ncbi:hypothetical protein ACWEOP_17675 [Streptomyces chartreusis]
MGLQRAGDTDPGRAPDGRGPLSRSEGRRGLADYADATKFADEWLHPHPGTDGVLAMDMGHVILRECFVERRVPYFTDYVRRFTDLPFLVTLDERGRERETGTYCPGTFVTAPGPRSRPDRRRRGAALDAGGLRQGVRRSPRAERHTGRPLGQGR